MFIVCCVNYHEGYQHCKPFEHVYNYNNNNNNTWLNLYVHVGEIKQYVLLRLIDAYTPNLKDYGSTG